MPVNAICRAQTQRLSETIKYVSSSSGFYRRKIATVGSQLSAVMSARDITQLPFTTREELQQTNWDFLCVPRSELVEIVETSGTTGKSVYIGLTRSDLERIKIGQRASFLCAETTPGDIFHISLTLDNLFNAGVAYYRGIQEIGATAIRVGPHNALRHVKLIEELRPTVIVAVPTFMVLISQKAKEVGIDVRQLGVIKAILVGETIRNRDFSLNPLGERIASSWSVECFSLYGITEATMSFCECKEHQGTHEHPEFVITEIIDEDGHVLPDGKEGELVITTLNVEGMPLLRYRTGDITFKISERCHCGRTSARIGPIMGRKTQRLSIKGTVLYPKTIENALLNISEIENYLIEAYSGSAGDQVLLRVGSKNSRNGSLNRKVRECVKAATRVTPLIKLCDPEEIRAVNYAINLRKPVTFIDRRPQELADGQCN